MLVNIALSVLLVTVMLFYFSDNGEMFLDNNKGIINNSFLVSLLFTFYPGIMYTLFIITDVVNLVLKERENGQYLYFLTKRIPPRSYYIINLISLFVYWYLMIFLLSSIFFIIYIFVLNVDYSGVFRIYLVNNIYNIVLIAVIIIFTFVISNLFKKRDQGLMTMFGIFTYVIFISPLFRVIRSLDSALKTLDAELRLLEVHSVFSAAYLKLLSKGFNVSLDYKNESIIDMIIGYYFRNNFNDSDYIKYIPENPIHVNYIVIIIFLLILITLFVIILKRINYRDYT